MTAFIVVFGGILPDPKDTRPYAERAEGPTAFDPEEQFDKDIDEALST